MLASLHPHPELGRDASNLLPQIGRPQTPDPRLGRRLLVSSSPRNVRPHNGPVAISGESSICGVYINVMHLSSNDASGRIRACHCHCQPLGTVRDWHRHVASATWVLGHVGLLWESKDEILSLILVRGFSPCANSLVGECLTSRCCREVVMLLDVAFGILRLLRRIEM